MSGELWRVVDGRPELSAVRCLDCGAVLVPPQHYGCISCGAFGDRIVDEYIEAAGTVHSFTMVHLHDTEPTPFLLGEIATTSRPLVTARLSMDDPVIGARVVGRITGEGETQQFEFVAEGAV